MTKKLVPSISVLLRILVLFLLANPFCLAQNYTVGSYQKINETNGGFTGILNDFDSWGIAIDNIGDLDGNGVNDLAVGAYTDDDGGFNRGAVWILFLDGNNQVISHTKISDTSGNFTGILDNDDRFGGSVAFLGDINGDGRIELAVGADYDGDGGHWHGAVWILSLNPDGTVDSHVKISDWAGGFTGIINGDAIFGTDMENIGDLNNDGIMDLAVGSRRDADGGSRRGALWILFMNADLTVNSYQKISDTQGGFAPALQFEDYFGGSVLNMGDLNGDGTNDLVVGSYRDDDQLTNSGSFYVLYLNPDGTVQSSQKVSNLVGGLSHQISGNALFGESIDGANDIDNDGIPEILVGALGHQNPTLGVQTGAFYMIELNNNGSVSEDFFYTYGEQCFSGVLEGGDFFGGAITFLNGGANPKIAVSAYHDSENGPERGAVWILDLGELSYSISGTEDPTSCAAMDGVIEISDLSPNSDYTITYEFEGSSITDFYLSDSGGSLRMGNLAVGNYTNIEVVETNTRCSDNVGSAVLNGGVPTAQLSVEHPFGCEGGNGIITLSDLVPSTSYDLSYFYQSNPYNLTITTNTSGELILGGLTSGTYTDITIDNGSLDCIMNLGNIELEDNIIDLDFRASQESSCGLGDGSIQIVGLNPSEQYTVQFNFNGNAASITEVANSMGEIELLALSAGIYQEVTVYAEDANCIAVIPLVEIECEESFDCFRAKKFFTPNGDTFHDYWYLESDDTCEFKVEIFDRFGKLLATLDTPEAVWDGNYGGKPMPSDDYWYIVYDPVSMVQIHKSHFTLKR